MPEPIPEWIEDVHAGVMQGFVDILGDNYTHVYLVTSETYVQEKFFHGRYFHIEGQGPLPEGGLDGFVEGVYRDRPVVFVPLSEESLLYFGENDLYEPMFVAQVKGKYVTPFISKQDLDKFEIVLPKS